MLQKVIASQAQWLAKKLDYGKAEEEVLRYSLNLVVSTVLGYGVLIAAAALLGVLPTALAAALSASALRIFSGGAHASRLSRCVGLGAVIFIAIGWFAAGGVPVLEKTPYLEVLASQTKVILIIIVTVGTGIIYFYAPAPAPGKPKQTYLQQTVMKSCSLVLLWWWGGTVWLVYSWQWGMEHQELLLASELGVVWQLMSLTPLGFGLLGGGEKILDLVFPAKEEKL